MHKEYDLPLIILHIYFYIDVKKTPTEIRYLKKILIKIREDF